ncbi:MAG: type II/IV secretion system protein [Patescibacteria group bacterium]
MQELIHKNSFKDFFASECGLETDVVNRLFDEVLASKKSVVDLVLSKGLTDETKLRDCLARFAGLKVGDVPYGLGIKTYQFISYKICYKYRVVTFEVNADLVRVATDNPLDLELREILDFLGRSRGVRVELFVVTRSELVDLIHAYQQTLLKEGLASQEEIDNIIQKYGQLGTKIDDAQIIVGGTQQRGEGTQQRARTDAGMDAGRGTLLRAHPDNAESDIHQLESQAVAEERVKEVKESEVINQDYSEEQKSWLNLLKQKVESVDELKKIINTRDIPRIVAAFVNYAIYTKASDIHIEAMTDKIRVRYRIDGVLQEIMEIDKSLQPALVSRIKILALLKIDEHRIPQDGQFRVTFEGRMVDLRISTLPTVHGEKVVIRILDVSSGRLTLDQLGLQGVNKQKVEKNIHRSNGMILSTGPTGSGKSTTLFSILGMVSVPGVNVITLEDPVEYHIPGVNQVQIKPDIDFTFARGLRSILRQDPNIIMVGEIRDGETAELAVHASLTGHLVLSTLHTNDAPSAVPRLIDMGIEPFLITSSLVLVMAQRLTRRICDHCKQEVKISEEKVKQIKEELKHVPPEHFQLLGIDMTNMKFYKGLGCDYCQDTGYKGRVAIFEVMEMSETIQDLAIAKSSGIDIFAQAVKEGMITMREDGFVKALQGMTTLDEVYRVTTK